MERLLPNFKFEVVDEIMLASDELRVLALLYQPIMGAEAFSLYTTLATLPAKVEYAHHLLLQIFDFNMVQLMEVRHYLEAAGLIETYESDERLIYALKKPLSVAKFFSDGVMSAFLYVKLGAKDFALIKQTLMPHTEPVEGVKVSKRFDEVFDIKALARVPQDIALQNYEETKAGVHLSVHFDQSTFASILIKKGISREIITQQLLVALNELAFLYKFDVHELARIVFDALDPAGHVDYVRMKSLARTQFQLMSKGEHVQVVVKDEKSETSAKDDGNDSQPNIIAFLEQNPIDFLRYKSGGKPPVPADMKLIEWLYFDQRMNPGVVNVLVDYVLKYTDGKLPKQLVEKIAGQWQRQNVNTVQAAMDKVIKTFEKRHDYEKEQQKPVMVKTSNLKKATRIEPIPDWLGKEDHHEKADDTAAKERVEQMKRAMVEVKNNAKTE